MFPNSDVCFPYSYVQVARIQDLEVKYLVKIVIEKGLLNRICINGELEVVVCVQEKIFEIFQNMKSDELQEMKSKTLDSQVHYEIILSCPTGRLREYIVHSQRIYCSFTLLRIGLCNFWIFYMSLYCITCIYLKGIFVIFVNIIMQSSYSG